MEPESFDVVTASAAWIVHVHLSDAQRKRLRAARTTSVRYSIVSGRPVMLAACRSSA